MKSFTINVGNFLKLIETNQDGMRLFDQERKKLVIPLYQREYKWTVEKICTLINDIISRDKFLGIIILDKTNNGYEIVDGQQRITTLYISLLCLYNLYNGQKLEQKAILSYLKNERNEYILENESIGNYIDE